eukprot:COSAG02_NODE_10400_length_1947_cov_4.324324_2_plen_192_part_00
MLRSKAFKVRLLRQASEREKRSTGSGRYANQQPCTIHPRPPITPAPTKESMNEGSLSAIHLTVSSAVRSMKMATLRTASASGSATRTRHGNPVSEFRSAVGNVRRADTATNRTKTPRTDPYQSVSQIQNVDLKATFGQNHARTHRKLSSLAFDERRALVHILSPKVSAPKWRKPLARVLPFKSASAQNCSE